MDEREFDARNNDGSARTACQMILESIRTDLDALLSKPSLKGEIALLDDLVNLDGYLLKDVLDSASADGHAAKVRPGRTNWKTLGGN